MCTRHVSSQRDTPHESDKDGKVAGRCRGKRRNLQDFKMLPEIQNPILILTVLHLPIRSTGTPFTTQGLSWGYSNVIIFKIMWENPALFGYSCQKQRNGSKNGHRIPHEGPFVDSLKPQSQIPFRGGVL